MEQILMYISTYGPILVAFVTEIGGFAIIKAALKKIKETDEFKKIIEQNKVLAAELKKSNQLNRELLTKIDRIKREEEEENLKEV